MAAVLEEEKIPAGSVYLTEEEQEECQSYLRFVVRKGDCSRLLKGELGTTFKRGIVSACMMGRARRFLHQAASSSTSDAACSLTSDEPEYGELAYEAAAKACDIFPVSINFYDFGCLLQEQGRHGKARMLFREFLRRVELGDPGPVERAAISKRDIASAIEHARHSL
jgi:hypothetical protein